MTEHPIIFSTPMIKAILDGSKTMTRRVIKEQSDISDQFSAVRQQGIKPEPKPIHCEGDIWMWSYPKESHGGGMEFYCPYGQVSSRLWVRETHYLYGYWVKNGLTKTGKQKWHFKYERSQGVRYFDNPPQRICKLKNEHGWFKRPSIFMPRWASRITLEITGIRVERLQDITLEDAVKEGFMGYIRDETPKQSVYFCDPISDFGITWNFLNAKRGYPWSSNPWVWCIEFRRLKP